MNGRVPAFVAALAAACLSGAVAAVLFLALVGSLRNSSEAGSVFAISAMINAAVLLIGILPLCSLLFRQRRGIVVVTGTLLALVLGNLPITLIHIRVALHYRELDHGVDAAFPLLQKLQMLRMSAFAVEALAAAIGSAVAGFLFCYLFTRASVGWRGEPALPMEH